VIETAERTVAEQLREPAIRELLQDLPEGEPHKLRRPDGPLSTWPELVPNVTRPSAAAGGKGA